MKHEPAAAPLEEKMATPRASEQVRPQATHHEGHESSGGEQHRERGHDPTHALYRHEKQGECERAEAAPLEMKRPAQRTPRDRVIASIV